MEIKLTLALPRDSVSVPVVRRVLSGALHTLGVEPAVVHAIEVALTEACTNVLDHADEGDEYEVSAGIDGEVCVLEVVDRADTAFDGSMLGLTEADGSAEEGRGIQLMRALVDQSSSPAGRRAGPSSTSRRRSSGPRARSAGG